MGDLQSPQRLSQNQDIQGSAVVHNENTADIELDVV